MPIQQLEQFEQRQRQLGFAVLIAREGIDAAAKDLTGLPLVKVELPSHLGDEVGIDISGIHLPLRRFYTRFRVALPLTTPD